MMTREIFTTQLKLAAILYRFIPRRKMDPITREHRPGRDDIFTFWFDTSGEGMEVLAKKIVKRYGELESQQTANHIVIDDTSAVDEHWCALTLREILMGEMFGRAHPMIKKEIGDLVIVAGKGMSDEGKRKLEKQVKEMGV